MSVFSLRSLPRRSLTVKGARLTPRFTLRHRSGRACRFSRPRAMLDHAPAIEDISEERSTISPRRRIVSRPISDFSRTRLRIPLAPASSPCQRRSPLDGSGSACASSTAAFQSLQLFARMIALLVDHDAGSSWLGQPTASTRRGGPRRRASSYRLRRPDRSAHTTTPFESPRAPACQPCSFVLHLRS